MNQNAKKWVAALRSGEYTQGRGCLRDKNERFCCLGVACDLYGKEHNVGWQQIQDILHFMERPFYLPEKVRAWLGLRSAQGDYKARNHRWTSLTARNDQDANFAKIASIIELEPEGLFE